MWRGFDMAIPKKSNDKGRKSNEIRYFLSFDLGLMGDYRQFYEWLDSKGAKECGPSVATFVSNKTRDQLAEEVKYYLRGTSKARAYLISLQHGGRFVAGTRKAAPWEGFAPSKVMMEDEV
jgi:hypothetical protein